MCSHRWSRIALVATLVASLAGLCSACGSSRNGAEEARAEGPTGSPAPSEPSEPSASPEPSEPSEPSAPTEADPVSAATDFFLLWSASSGPAFGERITVDAGGGLTWMAQPWSGAQPDEVHILRAQLDEEALRRFRGAVAEARLFSLDPLYRDPDINDGSQLTVRLRAGGREHRIECDNRFPPEIERLRSALTAQLLTQARREALAAAPIARPGDFGEQMPPAP